ncbi:MAG: hypothetical protein AAFU79_18480 [Myxococcota bacterium]
MTQIAPTFKQSRIREQGGESVREGGRPDGTQAGLFTHKPTAAIQGGKDQQHGEGGGDHPNREAVQFLRDAQTGQLKAVARGIVRSEKMRFFPEGSTLRLLGPNAQAAHFERETRVDLNRKDYLPTAFHNTAKFSSLQGARITFGDEDLPFNSGIPYDARRTTLPAEEHGQMQTGMLDARLNKGPVAWGLRHGAIRV